MGLPVIPDHGLCRSPTMQDALAANTEDNSDPVKEEDVTNIQQENGPVVEGDWVEGSGQDMGGVEVMYKMRSKSKRWSKKHMCPLLVVWSFQAQHVFPLDCLSGSTQNTRRQRHNMERSKLCRAYF